MAHDATARPVRHGDYAGFVTRMVAFILDRLLIAVILAGAGFFVSFVFQTFQLSQVLGWKSLPQALAAGLGGAAAAVFSIAYDVGCWVLAGQTPGKRLMGLLVVQTNGERLKLGRALMRWLGYWFSGILFLGFLWIVLDGRRQGFHDKLARTLVIYSRPEEAGLAGATPIRDRLNEIKQKRGTAGGGKA